jgi:hypothetical protein
VCSSPSETSTLTSPNLLVRVEEEEEGENEDEENSDEEIFRITNVRFNFFLYKRKEKKEKK